MQSSGETHRENAGVCPVFRIVGMGRSYLMHRHCEEPTGPASAGPMTGSATKPSRLSPRRDSGLRRCARNDGVERPRAQIYHLHAEEAAARGRLEAREPPAGPPSFESACPRSQRQWLRHCAVLRTQQPPVLAGKIVHAAETPFAPCMIALPLAHSTLMDISRPGRHPAAESNR